MHAAGRTHIEWTALLLGAALAALAVAGWQVQGGIDTPPAEVTLVAAPSEELALTPPGGTATTGTLRASEPKDGLEQRTTVQNATGGPLLVGLRAEPATAELDRTLLVRVSAGGEIVFDGPLGDLRAGTPGWFELASHESTEVRVQAWISPSVEDDLWRGRVQNVELIYVTKAD
jgi:hypothetical protein